MTQWNAHLKILKSLVAGFLIHAAFSPAVSWAQTRTETDTPRAIEKAYEDAARLQDSRRYYASAAKYFDIYTAGDGRYQNRALAKLTETLILSGLPNAASYFYIKVLQSGDRNAIRSVLKFLPAMLDHVGGDLLRKYLIRSTSESDYDSETRNHFFYFLGKDELLKGDASAALQALNKVSSGSGILAQASYLKGTAQAILGQTASALNTFEACERIANKGESRSRAFRKEYEDLQARCIASQARVLYQQGKYEDAEEVYDQIPKSSYVWTDILFEQAWNAFAKEDYNRALGKLVTYRSPSLGFVFNPEVSVLRAQSFLALCLYEDVNKTVNEFNSSYADIGGRLKNFLLGNENNLGAFYQTGRQAFYSKLHKTNQFNMALNRFVRGPYFSSLINQEKATARELRKVGALDAAEFRGSTGRGFGAFLQKVLGWRKKSIHLLGGLFVKNSMLDMYQGMLSDFDKISFIKLEMLSKAKVKLQKASTLSKDENGVMKKGRSSINRKDYQYFWNFNGEFWSDELGDYVFALESECDNASR